MATASMYVARRCGDEDAAAADGAGPTGVAGGDIVSVNVVFGGGDVVDDFEDFDFRFWRSFAKARRK
jgi:hypothetical protein